MANLACCASRGTDRWRTRVVNARGAAVGPTLPRYGCPEMGPLTEEHRPRIRAPGRWSARPSLTRNGQTALLALDVCRLDYRPPLLDVSPLQSDESFGRLLVMRGNFEPQIRQPFLHPWISQGIGDRCIELVDDRFRRRLGRPKPVPERRVESGQSGLIRGRNCGRHSKTVL